MDTSYPLTKLAGGAAIVAHKWNDPWGTCPCGHLVWVGDDDTHTCGGCGTTRPVIHIDGARTYGPFQDLTHKLHERAVTG
jgi:hypothetical protein